MLIGGAKVTGNKKSLDKKLKRFFDGIIYPVAIIEPILAAPQVVKIFTTKSAGDLALSSWVLYLAASLIWLSYGFFHREKPVIISSVLWLVVGSSIVIGILLYS